MVKPFAMAKEKKEKHFVQKPIYPGGPQALRTFITKHLRYPDAAKEAGVEGTVVVKYTIDYQGNVIEGKIISGLHKDCDEEAIRLVKLLKFRVPKQKRAGKIQFHKSIKIHFKQPKAKAPQPSAVQYKITPASKPADTDKKEQGGGYSYTISF
jgi:protein TonB